MVSCNKNDTVKITKRSYCDIFAPLDITKKELISDLEKSGIKRADFALGVKENHPLGNKPEIHFEKQNTVCVIRFDSALSTNEELNLKISTLAQSTTKSEQAVAVIQNQKDELWKYYSSQEMPPMLQSERTIGDYVSQLALQKNYNGITTYGFSLRRKNGYYLDYNMLNVTKTDALKKIEAAGFTKEDFTLAEEGTLGVSYSF